MSNIEIFAWCSSRELFVTGMTTTALPDGSMLATLSEDGNLIPHAGVIIDEIGPVVKTPAVLDEDGKIVTPAVIIEGHHVNLVAWGEMASLLAMGPPVAGPDGTMIPTQIPQYDEHGDLKSVFDRTILKDIIPGAEWKPITVHGVPEGFEGPNGVRLFDPAQVKSRSRVFL